MEHHHHDHHHDHHHHDDHSRQHEQRTKLVVILTAVTMVVEITFGYLTHSMALLSDGWHMGSHVFAIGLTFLAYYFSRRYANHSLYTFSKKNVLALSGFTSAIILEIVAVLMVIESVQHLFHPELIHFRQAFYIAFIGLAVNVISALFLHHDHEHTDHNIRAAYLHVIADAFTSVLAIVALYAGMKFNIGWLDAVSGIVGAIVITSWAVGLIKNAGRELIGFEKKE